MLKILEYRGFLTQKEIADESYLPSRTVRYALNRLKHEGLLTEKFYFKDARQSLYGLKLSLNNFKKDFLTDNDFDVSVCLHKNNNSIKYQW
ncbi:winged helix-turn-helix domain-containing protein [Methanohalobium sp.]|uniref:winged helix-turn-helix domain-containing protein n=1 Tax=Methanohalobium sp. TaxID=2837493 RepID=UPI0025F64F87|nr:winged helix-turn-helix domain-containing protein [Methanohalobium sp.]